MKNVLAILAALAILAIAYYLYTTNQRMPDSATQTESETVDYTSEVYTFADPVGTTVSIQYSEDAEQALLSLSGVQHELIRTRAASGARYESADGTIVYWEHQGEVTVEQNGETLIANGRRVSDREDTMTSSLITGTEWVWQHTALPNGQTTTAPAGEQFVLEFATDGRFTSTTDCNSVSGNYTIDGAGLSFGQMVSTKMFCADSLESTYTEQLGMVTSYVIDNSLSLTLSDGGEMLFLPPTNSGTSYEWQLDTYTGGELELPQTDVSLVVQTADTQETNEIATVDGDCNTTDEFSERTVDGSETLVCYYAGLGHHFVVTTVAGEVVVQQRTFEEASPEYTPPTPTFETILTL